MLPEFQLKKMNKIFSTFDINKDGELCVLDFEEVANRYIKAHNLLIDSPKAAEIRANYQHLWEECIQKPCNVNNDAFVSKDEWIHAFGNIINSKAGHEDIDFIGKIIYESVDLNQDRKVTYEEFIVFHQVYDLYEDKLSREVFGLIDNNHNGTLSKEEIVEAVNEFFYSNNTKAPGNYIFGKL
jgi:Ca2+-binding EF-hand superfamily protein